MCQENLTAGNCTSNMYTSNVEPKSTAFLVFIKSRANKNILHVLVLENYIAVM